MPFDPREKTCDVPRTIIDLFHMEIITDVEKIDFVIIATTN